ncbi:hypothetical protein TrRE_jg9235 [Triparma retinervis]|uniref:Uncharacterized protein n=1 Tax=Triparma retinervis TaxID=2557542 RepID=A0A9W7G4M2_9STRA|nr:hypothetical protein TrRE_jg9235 [Triparma retinervis]
MPSIETPDLHYMSIQLNLLSHHIRSLESSNAALKIENARLTARVRTSAAKGADGEVHMHDLWACLESTIGDELVDNIQWKEGGGGGGGEAAEAAEYCVRLDRRIVKRERENRKLVGRCKDLGETVGLLRGGLRKARDEIEVLGDRVSDLEALLKEERRLRAEERTIRVEFELGLSRERREGGMREERLKGENEILKGKLEELRGRWERRERIVRVGVEQWQEATRKLADRIGYLEGVRK